MGVLAAVHERERTGRGQHISAALANVAGFLQSVYMFDFPGYERHEIEGQDAVGMSALSRMYECADAWIFVHCRRSNSSDLVSALELRDHAADIQSDPVAGPNSWLAKRIAERLRSEPAAFWLQKLNDHRIAAVRVASMEDLQADPAIKKAGLIEVVEQGGETSEHVGIPHRLSMTPASSRWEAPALGADTVAVLKELGYDEDKTAGLFEENVVMT